MTYSHNNIRNNIKMTTAPASKTIRSKNGGGSGNSSGSGEGGGSSKSPSPIANNAATTSSSTRTTPVTAHSNSIASSTNYYSHHQLSHHHALSTSPPGGSMSSDASTCSSTSSLGSAGNGGSYFGNRHHQRQHHHQRKQQRHSPQQLINNGAGSSSSSSGGGGGGFFFQNNSNSNMKRAQKNRDSPRSPNGMIRQSPATILGSGYFSSASLNGAGTGSGSGSASGRKQRKSPLTFAAGGKSSPTHSLIPTAVTHFAGSKCFDAPAPTALPKPPQHWTLCKTEEKVASSAGPGLLSVLQSGYYSSPTHAVGHVLKSSKRNLLDEFDTHNLKLLLNVQS